MKNQQKLMFESIKKWIPKINSKSYKGSSGKGNQKKKKKINLNFFFFFFF